MEERLPECHLKILPAYEMICMQKTYRNYEVVMWSGLKWLSKNLEVGLYYHMNEIYVQLQAGNF